MITRLSDVTGIVRRTIDDPRRSLPAVLKLASSKDWKEREVAATILV